MFVHKAFVRYMPEFPIKRNGDIPFFWYTDSKITGTVSDWERIRVPEFPRIIGSG
jgi:hypothetical protein